MSIRKYFFIFLSLLAHGILGQGKLVLLPGSEKIYFDKATQTHRLVGTVSFTYQGNTMYCDSAHYREAQKIVRAYGNVHITKDDINLYCDSLFYSGSNKFARLWGHVVVRDAAYKLSSDSVEYNAKTGRAIYRNKGKIQNSINNELITSKIGYFYPATGSYFFSGKVVYQKNELRMTTDTLQFNHETQTTYFHGPTIIKNDSLEIRCSKGNFHVDRNEGALYQNVHILQKDRSISCDTAFYKEQNQEFTGQGNVVIDERKQNLLLSGHFFHSEEERESTLLTGQALAIQTGKKDSLFLHADTLRLLDDSLKQRNLFAYHHVRVFSRDIQCIADSAFYGKGLNRLSLYSAPILWAKNGELKGDTIHLYTNDSVLERSEILGNASAVMPVDTGMLYNQLSGKIILGFFDQGTLVLAKVKGQAWTIFYPVEEKPRDSILVKERVGLNRLYASELHVYLDSGEVSRITFFDKPDGVFFPMDQIDEKERYIRGFSWNPLLRPKDPYSMCLGISNSTPTSKNRPPSPIE
jgi:lipopolysaccharide export system protein LptA